MVFSRGDQRSYLQISLTKELQIGKTYYTQFFVRLRKGSEFACNNLGLLFSDSLIRTKGYGHLNIVPQIVHSEILESSENWIELRTSFIPKSNAKYLLIGNFFNNESTSTKLILMSGLHSETVVFLLIDDVYVGEEMP